MFSRGCHTAYQVAMGTVVLTSLRMASFSFCRFYTHLLREDFFGFLNTFAIEESSQVMSEHWLDYLVSIRRHTDTLFLVSCLYPQVPTVPQLCGFTRAHRLAAWQRRLPSGFVTQ